MFRKPKKRIIKKTLRKTNKEEDDQSNSNPSSSEEETEIIKCKPLAKKSKTTKEKSEDDKKFNLHKFESKDTVIEGKDLATRTAEYSTTAKQHNPNAAGPLRAPANVRTTCRFDYQPDICKDYKETGFCGFGDTCIYLHDRGDYKSGWQLEAEWEEKKKKEMEEKERQMLKFMQRNSADEGGNEQEDEEAAKIVEEDGIPYACHICRKAFQNPIVTSCNHYFCQDCISKHFRIDASCPICKKDTHGVFNYPTKLHAKKKRVLGSASSTFEDFLNAFRKRGTEAHDK